MGQFLDVILDLEAEIFSESSFLLCSICPYGFRELILKNVEFGAKEGSMFDDFCQEGVVGDIDVSAQHNVVISRNTWKETVMTSQERPRSTPK